MENGVYQDRINPESSEEKMKSEKEEEEEGESVK